MISSALVNPMHAARFLSPRCGAKTRRGTPCKAPAVRDRKRCRMHGGARGSGAPQGSRNGAWRHGRYSREAIERRQEAAELVRSMRALVRQIGT